MKILRIMHLCLAAGLAAGGLALLMVSVNASPLSRSTPPVLITNNLAVRSEIYPDSSHTWLLECADCPPQFTESSDRMLRLDNQGRAHLAYGRDHLYYTWFDGANWQTEVADSSFLVGSFASLALDEGDRPHISYFDEAQSALKYANRDATGWHVQTLALAARGSTSLALDDSGFPHISYWDGSHLSYAYQDAGGWHFEAADSAPQTGARSSLTLDSNNRPHISYRDQANSDLKYAHLSGGIWSTQTVDAPGDVGEYSSIVLDASGKPNISYTKFDPNPPAFRDLRYARWDGAKWITTTVDAQGNAGAFNSLAFDSRASPHISYYADNTLRHAYWDTGRWYTDTVDGGGNVGAYSSIALDAGDRIQIGYYESGTVDYTQKIKLAGFDATGWDIAVVASEARVGEYSSIDLDPSGYAHISYYDSAYDNLKYAYQDIAGWQDQTLDWAGNVGMCSQLKLDSSGYPHISYHDFSSKKLKYTYLDSLGWHTTVVDPGAASGCSSSLNLDQNDYAHISYYDSSTNYLKYAYRSAGGWTTQTVDRAGNGDNVDSSLAIDGKGKAHISYIYAPTADLRYAHWDGADWITTTLDTTGSVGWNSSIALNADGYPSIAYRDDSNRDLKLASFDGIGWTVVTVDGSGDTGRHPSLAVGQDGSRQISYTGDLCPGACARLKYALQTSSGWITETIPSPGAYYGLYSSLSLNREGIPRISFFDADTGDLIFTSTPVSLTAASIAGPPSGTVGIAYTFTASISPPDATIPITYSWQADGQPQKIHVSARTDAVSYTWTTPGPKLISISADNRYSQIGATHTITISDAAISGLSASNSSPTPPGQVTTLSASILTGSNVTFSWQFGDGSGGAGQQVDHTYPAAGIYTATVTASNSVGSAQATTRVLVGWWSYLPLVPDEQ